MLARGGDRVTDELRDGYDVVVLGGGPAGLNGALMLARARRSVVVVDAGAPRNAPAGGVHGLLGHDGTPPAELLERGRAEVRRYGGHVVAGEVTTAVRNDQEFAVLLADGRSIGARRLLVATGLADELPEIPGLRERWGREVVYCPYCHGWEVRDQAIGVLASGPLSVHQALLFRQLSDDVIFFSHISPPDADQTEQLAARSIRIVGGEVASVEIFEDRLAGVRMRDGTVISREALAVSPRMVARAGFLAGLGLRPTEQPAGVGEHIPCDAAGRTEVPGVWVAGNVTDPMAQVGAAASAGAAAAAQINFDLVNEETSQAAAARRDTSSSQFWDAQYAARDRKWSGDPNPHLVDVAAALTPGRALDVGSGEGADALWLASRGWMVTGIDISPIATGRARQSAVAAGLDQQVDFVVADFEAWAAATQGVFDLVSIQFLHLESLKRDRMIELAATLVADGGTIVVAGHDLVGTELRHAHPSGTADIYFSIDQVRELLPGPHWNVRTAQIVERGTGERGHHVADVVITAVRRE
jgi:thioredoxin reductase